MIKNIITFINKLNTIKSKLNYSNNIINNDTVSIECSKNFFYNNKVLTIIDYLNDSTNIETIKFTDFYNNNKITMSIFLPLYITFLYYVNAIDIVGNKIVINNNFIKNEMSIYETFVLLSENRDLGIAIYTSPVIFTLTITLSFDSFYIFNNYIEDCPDNIQKLNAFNTIMESNLYNSLISQNKKLKYISNFCTYPYFILKIL